MDAVRVLTVNGGSSSLKLRVVDHGDSAVWSQDLPGLGAVGRSGEALAAYLHDAPPFDAVAHRFVHGGADLVEPERLDDELLDRLEGLAGLAPLHLPPAIALARGLRHLWPDIPAVACFDTAFHAELPAAARALPLPRRWLEPGRLRRFGFHGLSHAYATRRTAELLHTPVDRLCLVSAHLGSGSSLAAVRHGFPVETTMSCTPLDGLVMATRPGATDPGLLVWLLRHGGVSLDALERGLERESGLLALSDRSGDLHEIVAAAEAGDECCRLAVDVWVVRVAAGIAAMATALGRLDAVTFTGGIGEHADALRARVVGRLEPLGVTPLRGVAPAAGDVALSRPGDRVAVLRVACREDVELARAARELLVTDRAPVGVAWRPHPERCPGGRAASSSRCARVPPRRRA